MTETQPSSQALWAADPVALAHAAAARATSHYSAAILRLYRFVPLRRACLRLCERLEGGAFNSATLRAILDAYHGVSVGRYSYGPILRPGVLPRGSRVGAYCSVGRDLIVRRRDHPVARLSQHPFFYNHRLGYLRRDTIAGNEDNPLAIGNDVWIGDRVTIVSGCRSIGNGAVIAAGAVVARDVAPYTVVGGVPARPLRRRFDEAVAAVLEASQWWELDAAALLAHRRWLGGTLNLADAREFAEAVAASRRSAGASASAAEAAK